MDIGTTLIVSILFGSIGTGYFLYGKKQQRWPHMLAGIVFTVYPYFATSVTTLVGGGVLIGATFWLAIRSGW